MGVKNKSKSKKDLALILGAIVLMCVAAICVCLCFKYRDESRQRELEEMAVLAAGECTDYVGQKTEQCARDYLWLSEDEAIEKAKENGLFNVNVVSVDGVYQNILDMSSEGSFDVEKGVVIRVCFIGARWGWVDGNTDEGSGGPLCWPRTLEEAQR